MSHNGLVLKDMREAILEIEDKIANQADAQFGDDCFPLEHFFCEDLYIRKIFMPAGYLLTSKIHKHSHPYFILKGDVEVLTEAGMVKISAPYFGITKAGTKRVILTHTDTTWLTVHSNPTNTEDLKEIEGDVIAKSFADVPKTGEKICHGQPLLRE